MAEQLHGGIGGEEWIETLIDHVVDAHVATAGRAGELPHAGGPDVRAGARIERRLDMGQGGEFHR